MKITYGFTLSSDKAGKDQGKANYANAYIGFDVKNRKSSTGIYLEDARRAGIPVNDKIVPDGNTVAFVSVASEGLYNKKTIRLARKVIAADGTIIMDASGNAFGQSHSHHNKNGEGAVQDALETPSGQTVEGYNFWRKAQNIPPVYYDIEISRTIKRLDKEGKLENMTMANLEEEILCDIRKMELIKELIDSINSNLANSSDLRQSGDLETAIPSLSLLAFAFGNTKLSDDVLFDYAQKINSSFCFNALLVPIIENLVEQNDIVKAKEYMKFYRLDGFMELKQAQIFRVRYYFGANFDHFIWQCVYLEAFNKGLETDEDFQTLFNRELVKPYLSMKELPKPLRLESLIKKIGEIPYGKK
jgi:hypothetical protein